MFAGSIQSKYLLLGKADSEGNVLWTRTWVDHTYPKVKAIKEMSDGNIHMVGLFCENFLKCSESFTGFIAMFDSEGSGLTGSYRTSSIPSI